MPKKTLTLEIEDGVKSLKGDFLTEDRTENEYYEMLVHLKTVEFKVMAAMEKSKNKPDPTKDLKEMIHPGEI